MSHPTPKYNLKQFPNVYEPAEDSFLLLDTLEMEDWNLIKPTIILEIGSGSGIVSAFLATIIGPDSCIIVLIAVYLCSDVNAEASTCTNLTGKLNNVHLNPILCEFNTALRCKADVVVFNPPYVVTGPEEVGSRSIAAAWAGGVDGRQVIDEFIPLVDKMLSSTGMLFLVVVDENKPQEIIAHFDALGFECKSNKRSAGREKLYVLRFCKRKS